MIETIALFAVIGIGIWSIGYVIGLGAAKVYCYIKDRLIGDK